MSEPLKNPTTPNPSSSSTPTYSVEGERIAAWRRPVEDVVEERLLRLQRANEDWKYRAVVMAVIESDPVRFLNDWCWTFDPRLKGAKTIPFRLFPRQVEFIHWLQQREELEEDGLVEKSRDAGATWVACGYVVHAWLFRKGFSAGFGSRKQNLVDQIGDPDSIFEKMRILLRGLPKWMLPERFDWGKHDNFCKILNPANGSSITGEAGDNIGRGGRKTLYFIDESAHIARPQKIDAALSATTRCRIDISTPCGPGNSFAKKRFSGLIEVFQFHWRQDPRKDDAWYEKEKLRLDSVTLAQEVDIDYNASIEGLAIPAKWVNAAVGFAAWLKETRGLEMPRNGPRRAGLDIAEEGKDRSVLVSGVGYVIDKIESWGQLNTTQTANKAGNYAREWKVAVLNYDGVGIGTGVKGTWNSSEQPLGFESHPINVGNPPSSRRWPSGRLAHEIFANLKAELWWSMRVRFEKTYEYREEGIFHELDLLISLPDRSQSGCSELAAQLAMPLADTTDTNKIRIESKKALTKRGIKSPDYAEALSMYFAQGKRKIVADAA